MEYTIRKIRQSEYHVLDDFLYEAIFIPEGIEAPPKEIIKQPELKLYTENFGGALMSKEYWGFEKETGETGFLAGVVDVLSDNLGMLLDFPYAMDADIFYVKDNDISLLNDAVKNRLHYYNKVYDCKFETSEIDSINFDLNKHEFVSNEVLAGQISSFSSGVEISAKVDDFFRTLNWYLNKPLYIYSPKKLPDKNVNVMGGIYLTMAWHYFFISYYDYFVLFIFGTAE